MFDPADRQMLTDVYGLLLSGGSDLNTKKKFPGSGSTANRLQFSCATASRERFLLSLQLSSYPAATAGTAPNLRSRDLNSRTASARSAGENSGHFRSVKYSSAYAHS